MFTVCSRDSQDISIPKYLAVESEAIKWQCVEEKRAVFLGIPSGEKEWRLKMFIIALSSALCLLFQLMDEMRGLGNHGESREIRFIVQTPGSKLCL